MTMILSKVYRSARKPGAYLYVSIEQDLELVPESLLEQLGHLSEVMTLKLEPERRLANADVQRVMQEITDKGFYLQLPPLPASHRGSSSA